MKSEFKNSQYWIEYYPQLNILLFPYSSTSQEDDEDEFYHFIDKTALEQWRLSGLPSDTFFTENAIAIQESAK